MYNDIIILKGVWFFMNHAELKQKAKESLKEKYSESLKILLLTIAIQFIVNVILEALSGLLNLNVNANMLLIDAVNLIINGFISFGSHSFYLKISRNEKVNVNELFSKKDLFITYITLALLVGMITGILSILLIIPGIIAACSLSQVYYIVLDNPEIGTIDAMNESHNMMKGHKTEYFLLMISFLGWLILGIFTLGILYFWLIPYINVTKANFYNSIKNQNNTTSKEKVIAE